VDVRDPKTSQRSNAPSERSGEKPGASARSGGANKPRPMKPGQGVGLPHGDDEAVAEREAEARQARRLQPEPPKLKEAARAKPMPKEQPRGDERGRQDRGQDRGGAGGGSGGAGSGGAGSGGGSEPRFVPPTIQVGGSFSTAKSKGMGIATGPSAGDFVRGQGSPKAGKSFAEVIPGARMRRDDLPEPEHRPPAFLSTFEGMKDIYMRVKGRMSPKTKELLEGTDLEDLVTALAELHDDEKRVKAPEARLSSALFTKLKDEPGPLLLGFQDPKLREPWRLFLDGWEIWVPEKKDAGGVELFWEGEGEAEEDDGDPVTIAQTLRRSAGEMVLDTQLGTLRDVITYDGQAFFRLKSDRDG
jgi:hypothetical protein